MTERVHTVIVGSGPAGLSAAAHAAAKGLDHVLLEKTDHLSDTIYRYQRGKHVMATPVQLPLRSDVPFAADTRESILGKWRERAESLGIKIRYGAEVTEVTGEKGDFSIGLAGGQRLHAERIILAIGTQGNPNRMSCAGGDLDHVQYQLDDPTEYIDEAITIVGGGDAAIENALGLAADAAQGNVVTLLNRSESFARAKEANAKAIEAAVKAGRITVLASTKPSLVEPGLLTVETPEGVTQITCNRIIARLGAAPPRAFLERIGVRFTSSSPAAYPELSPTLESSTPGIYVIGALAGYPLIKHCLNQGYDVIEHIAGATDLEPADEPLLAARFAGLPGSRSVQEWLSFLNEGVEILRPLSPLQMREFMLDSTVRAFKRGEVVFKRDEPGSSLFGIASGAVAVEIDPNEPTITVPIGGGSIFGEVGLISGRRRGSTVRAAEDCILVELSRTAALKMMATVPETRALVDRISTERQILQVFKSGVSPEDIRNILATAKTVQVKPGEAIIEEGELGSDLFVVRSGSMVVEKQIGSKPVFLSYLPAGSFAGEMALIDGAPRSATVRAAIRSEVVRFDGETFRRLLAEKPALLEKLKKDMASRQAVNAFVESRKESFKSPAGMYSSVASFLVDQGIGEATDVLLIDEALCVGCDNCEKACAETHDGLSRLNREAGRTYAHLHVPTSCRHCEHPYCMTDCPPNAIHRGADGEVFIDDTCIGCGACQRNCPYDVIRMEAAAPEKPGLLSWLLFGMGPGPGEPSAAWKYKQRAGQPKPAVKAIKCDMCAGRSGGPACVSACPTGAAIRVSPESFLAVAVPDQQGG